MADRVMVAIDEDLAELLREHLPALVERITAEPQAAFTIEEAANQWRVSKSTVEQMLADGRIRGVHFGRRVVIPRHEIDRVLQLPPARAMRRVG